MILGISASGRSNGVTSEAVKAVLEATGLEYEYSFYILILLIKSNK